MTPETQEIIRAREWLSAHCHRAEVRHILLRGADYVEAVIRAGLTPDCTDGDDLYDFLTDDSTAEARMHAFIEPTL